MRTLNLRTEQQPQLKLELPDGSEMILTRRPITVAESGKQQKKLEFLKEKLYKKEITDIEFCFETLESLTEGVDREKLETIDIVMLKVVIDAVKDLSASMTPVEKKTE